MTSPGKRLLTEFMANKAAKGRTLSSDEIVECGDRMVAIFLEEAKREWEARHKERKRANIDERARDILNVYPRREGGNAALQAITKSINEDGFETVLERTTEYASAVARWAPNRKKAQSGSSLIPLPTTWFGNKRYFDDSKAWWEGTGGREKAKEPTCLPEPEGWRFAHPESRFVTENIPWSAIDLPTQKWIIENTDKQRAHA